MKVDYDMTKVLLIYPSMIPSVKLCALEPLLFLQEQGEIILKHYQSSHLKLEKCIWCDVAIYVRGDSEVDVAWAQFMKRNGKYVIYILDDDLINIAPNLTVTEYYQRKSVRSSIKELIYISDCFLSPSPLLIQKYGHLSKRSAQIEEPCLIAGNPQLFKAETPVKIGYAGSVDREADLNTLLDTVVKEILELYGDRVRIEFLGARPECVEKYSLTHYPYTNSYEAYQRKMRELNWDIGLAPLSDTPFNNCKHYNKFIEYASFGIVGLYSDVQPYNRIIKSGVNGFLCVNEKSQWVKILSQMIDNPEKLLETRRRTYKQVTENFSVAKIAQQFTEAEPQVLNYHSPKNNYGRIRIRFRVSLLKVKMFTRKVYYFFKRNKLKSLLMLFQKIYAMLDKRI